KTRSRRTPEFGQGPGPADVAFSLVQADLLRGKSIGFLPTKVHAPKDRERELNGWSDVKLVIDEWILLEYACTFLPAQQNAVVEAVSKSLLTIPDEFLAILGVSERPMPFTPFEEIERAIHRAIDGWDIEGLARRCIAEQFDRARGRV